MPAIEMPAKAIRNDSNVGLDALRIAGAGRPLVLCVDDEPEVLEGLSLHLERPYRLLTATSAEKALAVLKQDGPVAIVISDMRMPGMDGATFLSKVREHCPETIRILLTGYADLDAAIAAVNEGQVFRFLTKPCPPTHLLSVLRAATEQYRMVLAERVLLEMTLSESVKAFVEVLALSDPIACGRAKQIARYVSAVIDELALKHKWPIEVAAMVSQIGCLSLPKELVEKLHYGRDLSAFEQEQVGKLPLVAEKLIAHIPRLEDVRAILNHSASSAVDLKAPIDPDANPIRVGGEILRITTEFCLLHCRGFDGPGIVGILRSRKDRYHPHLIEVFTTLYGGSSRERITEIAYDAIQVGMILAEDIYLKNGMILAGRGYEVTPQFVERARNWRLSTVSRVVRIVSRQT